MMDEDMMDPHDAPPGETMAPGVDEDDDSDMPGNRRNFGWVTPG